MAGRGKPRRPRRQRILKTIALYNLKGGVGKTAGAVNLAYLAALSGRRTLIWDLDPQGAATFYFRIQPKVEGGRKKLLKTKGRKNPLETHIRGTDFERLDLMPADFSYRTLDVALADAKGGERWLADAIASLEPYYETVFLDCAPSISRTSDGIFRAADALVLPMIPTTLSMRTLEQLLGHLDRQGLGDLPVWPFFSMVDRRKKMHRDFLGSLSADDSYFDTVIPNASQVERMGVERNPVSVFAGRTAAAKAYLNLWGEIEQRLERIDSRGDD